MIGYLLEARLTGCLPAQVDGGMTAQHLRKSLNLSLENIRHTRDLMTYQGAATNAFVGAFAGIADIQGCDACVYLSCLCLSLLQSSLAGEPAAALNSNPRISCRADAAACAPTQLAAVETLPLSYPYHYLRNARNNHMPLTFWGYSQLYDPPDSVDAVASERDRVGTGWDYDPQQNELVAQVSTTDCDGS